MSRIVLWRHAPTPSNADGRVQGRLDVDLDAAGLARAAWAAERIAARYGETGERALRVFSSPLRRAVQTAETLTALVGGSVVVDEAFNQRSYGAWEGLTWDEVKRDWPAQWEQRERGVDPDVPGWDGQEAVAARVLAGLERIWDDEVPAVVVTHGSPITLGLLAAIGEPASSVVLGRVPHAAAAVVTRVESGAWHIEAFGLGAD
ncbi:histidine phosphatase family protein [Demequina sp.]|uniref:histidine phosphatase family protein n=1 Tax=Demequina sp. TaxID=2050685 RepID=UPI003D119BC0